ncbi:MAG: TonB-dependent receptor [Saprospiraceae bacterium]
MKNALVKRAFTLNGQDSIIYDGILSKVEAIQNAASATVKGMQLGLEWKMGHGLTLQSVYNIQDGEEELDNGSISPSRHAAPNFGMSSLTWQKQKWTISAISQYSAGKTYAQLAPEEQNKPELYAVDTDGKPYSPSWWIVSLKTAYRLTNHFNLQAGVENITDQRYRPYSSGIAAAGRNFIISATCKL